MNSPHGAAGCRSVIADRTYPDHGWRTTERRGPPHVWDGLCIAAGPTAFIRRCFPVHMIY